MGSEKLAISAKEKKVVYIKKKSLHFFYILQNNSKSYIGDDDLIAYHKPEK